MSSASASASEAQAPVSADLAQAAQAKTLEEYMDEIKKNKELIDGQQQIITSQIAQGEKVLNTLKSSVSMTMPQEQGPAQAQPRPAQAQAQARPEQAQSRPAQSQSRPAQTPIQNNSQISALEEAEKKKRKKDDWISKPKILKGDWEKRKREHDEKVKKSERDIQAYEDFVADKSEDEIKELESAWEKRGFRTPFQVLRKAKNEAEEFIKKDVIPRADIDKRFAEQREARKKVLLEFQNSLNLLNTQIQEINNKIKENINNKRKFLTMSDEEKKNSRDYELTMTEENNLKNEKLAVEKKIRDLTTKKDNELAPIDAAIAALKNEANEKEVGGKTRKKRTKNMKRRQSRKYKV
jgi:hypothetical protein